MRFEALARKAGAASTAVIGAGALVVGTAVPGTAADEAAGGAATATALEVEFSGQAVGDRLEAAYNGTKEVVDGVRTPELPEVVTGGALSQDAIAGEHFSAACAGVLGGGATVSLNDDGSCLTDPQGGIELSLGTLRGLGVPGLLSRLPEVADVPDLGSLLDGLPLDDPAGTALPDADLKIVGQAITARCTAEPAGVTADSTAADLRLVADVDGTAVVLGDITPDGLSLGHQELLARVAEELPAGATDKVDEVLSMLEQLPTSKLAEQMPQLNELISIRTDVRNRTSAGVEVSALRVDVAGAATGSVVGRLLTSDLAEQMPQVGSLSSFRFGPQNGDDAENRTSPEDLANALQGTDLGPASLRFAHVDCSDPSAAAGDDTGDAGDAEAGQTRQGDGNASSQRNPTPERYGGVLNGVTDQVVALVDTARSLLNVL